MGLMYLSFPNQISKIYMFVFINISYFQHFNLKVASHTLECSCIKTKINNIYYIHELIQTKRRDNYNNEEGLDNHFLVSLLNMKNNYSFQNFKAESLKQQTFFRMFCSHLKQTTRFVNYFIH
jgi:hypothetical protein